MNLIISNSSGQPIYEQICQQIKQLIQTGRLTPGQALPSIRLLAKDLRISVITTKRAYEELEREGYVYTVAGKGSFVAERNPDLLREENLRAIESHMEEIARLAAGCGLNNDDLVEMFTVLHLAQEEE
ncbi:MAG TPA: GntR family transcriptional regulator [Candidatus Onthomonas avicola]|nr:GntR family transcriptional regulator [Candidatus Onthomonas avicola]